MAQLVLQEDIKLLEDSDDDMMANPDEVNNYKGMYQDDEDEPEQRNFEFGAHFPYQLLCDKLEDLQRRLYEERVDTEETTGDLNSNQHAQDYNFRRNLHENKNTQIKNRSNSNNTQGVIIENRGKDGSNAHKTQFNTSNFKPQSLNLANSNSNLENNYLQVLGNNFGMFNNKSRNVGHTHMDNTFKHATGIGMQIAATAITKNIVKNNYIQSDGVKEEKEGSIVHTNRNNNNAKNNNINENKQSVPPGVLINNNTNTINLISKKSNSTSRNMNGVLAGKKEEKKTQGILNIYSSFTHDIMNFNQKSKETSLKKIDNAPGQLFKKSNPVILVDKGGNSSNTNTNPTNKTSSLKATKIHTKNPITSSIKEIPEEKSNIKKKVIHYSAGSGLNTTNNQSLNKNQINYSLSKIGVSGNVNMSIVTNVINTYNSKHGRNQAPHMNPQNTANPHNPTSTTNKSKPNTSTGKSGVSNTNQSGNIKKEIKKLNFDKIQTSANKNDAYRYITSSVDNRDGKGGTNNNVNFDLGMRILNNKNNSLSPSKVGIDSNSQRVGLERVDQNKESVKDQTNVNPPSTSVDVNVQSTGLNDIISQISKQENKSRNAPRNNLTSTKSNLFSSEKAQSMHSGSYHKTSQLFTQAAVKTTANVNNINSGGLLANKNKKPVSNSKPKIAGNNTSTSKGNIVTMYKPGMTMNKTLDKTKINLKPSESKSNLVKKNTSLGGVTNHNHNLHNHGNNVNITKSNELKKSVASNPQPSVTTSNSTNTKVLFQKESLFLHSNKVALENSPNKLKITNPTFKKIDSSKQKTKSNSVTSNASNGNTSNPSVIKSTHFNKNTVKPSNVSYLNLKKNEYSIARNITIAPSDKSSKALINTVSSGSLDNNILHSHQELKKLSKESSKFS